MADSYVDLQDIPVMRLRADMKGQGPSEAFKRLESKLPTLKQRRFYGIYRLGLDGEEYYACVAVTKEDDPAAMGLETWVIPGGRHVRRRVLDYVKIIDEGSLPKIASEMADEHQQELAPEDQFTIEYYRSHRELHLLMPLKHG